MVLLASQEITDYQVVQSQPGQLSIALTIAPRATFASVSASVVGSVESTLALYACQPAQVDITEGIVPPEPGAKRRRVQALRV